MTDQNLKNAIGKTFKFGGRVFRIVAYKPKFHVNPVFCQIVGTDKKMQFPASIVQRQLAQAAKMSETKQERQTRLAAELKIAADNS